jgi:hypothetical protein
VCECVVGGRGYGSTSQNYSIEEDMRPVLEFERCLFENLKTYTLPPPTSASYSSPHLLSCTLGGWGNTSSQYEYCIPCKASEITTVKVYKAMHVPIQQDQ